MGFWHKLNESQKNFDERTIERLTIYYVPKYKKLTKDELELKLAKLEQKPAFQQEKASKRVLLFGAFGAAAHIDERDREARKKAIRICLHEKAKRGGTRDRTDWDY
jgi:hypothetical protein